MYVKQLPSGHWRVIVQANGHKRTGTAGTRTDATMLGAQLLLALGAVERSGEITVHELVAHHLANVQPHLSPTTYAEYHRVAHRLDDRLGLRKIDSLHAPDITAHYQWCAAHGWAPGTIRRLHELLHTAWKRTAIHNGWAVINPVAACRKPSAPARRITPPSPGDIRRLLDAADDQFRLFLRLSATSGARRGEHVALRWEDIDLDRGEVLVARSLVYTPTSGVVLRDGKTGRKGHRRIALDPGTVAHLEQHRELQAKAAANVEYPEPVYVFSHDHGQTPWRPDGPTATFRRLRTKVGVTGVRLHDLRHYVATRMLSHGESVVQVAARLGHATPSTTMAVYAHWLPARDRAAADALAAELDD